jgi:hypothetical protein
MRGLQQIPSLLASGFIISGLLLSACSGGGSSDGETNEGSSNEGTEESTEQPQSSSEQPPQFNPDQGSGGSDSVSDEKLKQFSGAMDANRKIQQNMMPQMQQAVKDAGLSMDKYQQIDRKQRGGGQGMQGNSGDSDISEEQLKKFNQAKKNLQPVQEEMRKKMESAIKEEGMSMQEYRSILQKIRQSRELQQRMREMQGGSQQQQQRRPQQQRQQQPAR